MDTLPPHGFFQQELPLFSMSQFEHVVDGCQCDGKICIRCNGQICIKGFFHDKRRANSSSVCLKCHTDYHKTYREKWDLEHREQRQSQGKEWYKANKERKKVYQQAHAHRINAYQRAYRKLHPERVRGYAHKYAQSHSAQHASYNRKLRELYPERYKAYWTKHEITHPDRIRAKRAKRRTLKTQSGGSFTPQQWRDLKASYNYTCLRCGRKEPEIKLTADHIVPVVRGGSSDIDNIQPLCGICNSHKHIKIIDYRVEWRRHHGN